MAVKTTNYVNEQKGVTLPVAYGVLEGIKVRNNNYVTAVFAVKASREHVGSVDTVNVSFTWDRKTNLAEMAYNEAKGQKIVEDFNYETGEPIQVTVNGPFYGWEDDRI